ncbi:hypothetical protein Hanom_Chr15g01370241 [Helianthus anomalus]
MECEVTILPFHITPYGLFYSVILHPLSKALHHHHQRPLPPPITTTISPTNHHLHNYQ